MVGSEELALDSNVAIAILNEDKRIITNYNLFRFFICQLQCAENCYLELGILPK